MIESFKWEGEDDDRGVVRQVESIHEVSRHLLNSKTITQNGTREEKEEKRKKRRKEEKKTVRRKEEKERKGRNKQINKQRKKEKKIH